MFRMKNNFLAITLPFQIILDYFIGFDYFSVIFGEFLRPRRLIQDADCLKIMPCDGIISCCIPKRKHVWLHCRSLELRIFPLRSENIIKARYFNKRRAPNKRGFKKAPGTQGRVLNKRPHPSSVLNDVCMFLRH